MPSALGEFIDVSLSHYETLYERLGVLLERGDVMAESAYNDDLTPTVEALDTAGLLTESDGAQCVFLDEFKGKTTRPCPSSSRNPMAAICTPQPIWPPSAIGTAP